MRYCHMVCRLCSPNQATVTNYLRALESLLLDHFQWHLKLHVRYDDTTNIFPCQLFFEENIFFTLMNGSLVIVAE